MRSRPSVLVCILLLVVTAYVVFMDLMLIRSEGKKEKKYLTNIPVAGPEEPKANKYVILAGPHKTASTSIQFNLYCWSELGWLGNDWAWMKPNITCLREQSPIYCPSVKSVFNNEDWYCKAWACLSLCLFRSLESNQGTDQCTHVISCYTENLQRQHEENNQLKLVFGSESIATHLVALLTIGKDPTPFLQGLLNTLPSFTTKDEITFVITYRSPRIDHLRSWWKASAYHENQTLSFRSFLRGDFNTSSLDPLYAAKEIVTYHGFKVIVIDMSGVQAKGWDISSVVACELLDNVPCHVNNMTLLLGGNGSKPFVRNVRGNKLEELNNLTQEETLQISDALQKLDCNSVHAVFHHPRIQVLYPYNLNQTLRSCIQNPPFYSHEQLKQDLQSIVSQNL